MYDKHMPLLGGKKLLILQRTCRVYLLITTRFHNQTKRLKQAAKTNEFLLIKCYFNFFLNSV